MRRRQPDRFVQNLLPWTLFAVIALVGCGGGDEPLPEATPGAPDELDEIASALEALKAPEPDKVVATVNGAEIRAGKVYEVAALNMLNLEAQGQTLSEQEERSLRMSILEMIINDELLAQEAETLGITVDEADVETRLQEVRDQHGTAAAFEAVLAETGVTEEEFRSELSRRLLSQEFLTGITNDVKISDEEARSFYEQFPEQFSEGETVEVRQILIRSLRNDPEARRTAARERAEEAHRRAVTGEDFAMLAKEYSQAPNAADGGLVSHFPRGVMVPQFEEVAFGLEPGEISDVFETDYGFNVIMMTDRKEPTRIPFAEIKPTLMVDLAKAKEAMLVQSVLKSLQQKSDVRVLDSEFLPPAPGEAAEDGAEGSPEGS